MMSEERTHSRQPRGVSAAKWGFTLIELLVVIGVIGILAALLLPVFSKAKQSAWMASCLENQKQLITAWMMYADDNRDLIVGGLCNSAASWRIGNPFSNLSATPPSGLDPLAMAAWEGEEGFREGQIYRYAQNPKIIHCPGDPRPKASIIGYDSYSVPEGMNGGAVHYEVITKRSQLAHPSDRFVFIEEFDPRGDNQGSWWLNSTGPANGFRDSAWIDSPAVFHGGSSSFAWADGHATNRRWLAGDTMAFASSTDTSKFSHQPDPPDNPDIIFVATGFGYLGPDPGNP